MVKWSTGPFVIGGMLQENQDDADTLDESGVFASLAYTQGQHVLKAQVGQLDNDASAGAYEKESTLALGYDHKLSNNTLWFAYFNRNSDKTAGGNEVEQKVFGVGLEHKF